MSTKPIPLQFGQYYHIYNRGNNRENLFHVKADFHHFLKLYAYHVEPVAETFAYCLLPNHFHILARIKLPEEQTPKEVERPEVLTPSHQFGTLFNAHTKRFNKLYQRTGSLFEHPFKRLQVNTEAYFRQLVIYIHRNPQKHGLMADFRDWPYSSYQTLFSEQPTLLRRQTVLDWFEGSETLQQVHERLDDKGKIAALWLED